MGKSSLTHAEKASRTLKSARAKADLTQDDVALAMGVSKSAISKWEKNIDSVNFGDVLKLCSLLKIDLSELAS